MINQLKQSFLSLYGESREPLRVFHAPGRVNLIGEHTDYNGGYVFPGALTFGTFMLIRNRDDRRIRFASGNFPTAADLESGPFALNPEHDWINYPKAVLQHLQLRGFTFGGYDVLFHGEIPNGAGLSSSASIEVVTGFGFLTMEGHQPDKVELALVAQEAENRFMGVNCGIMDQFAVAMGKADHAILLKCDSLEYEHVPFNAQGYRIVIGNTNKRRGLVDSEYNARRAQCEQAVADLSRHVPGLKLLGEIGPEQLAALAHHIGDPVVGKRARHVVEENDRVLQSVIALRANDLAKFGSLMNASHDSLRDLYEVTCKELDVMVEAARGVEGVLGSRMTGAGFGGCTVSLVSEQSVEAFIRQVGVRYEAATGLKPEFYVCEIGDGVKELQD